MDFNHNDEFDAFDQMVIESIEEDDRKRDHGDDDSPSVKEVGCGCLLLLGGAAAVAIVVTVIMQIVTFAMGA